MKKMYIIFMIMWLANTTMHGEISFKNLLDEARQDIHTGELQAALQKLKAALACRSDDQESNIELANNFLWLGNQFFERNENHKALETFKEILTISDQFACVHHNIAFTLAERFGAHEEALEYYKKSLFIRPDNIETHFCASLSYLATGDFIHGFTEYEYRLQRGINSSRNFSEQLEKLWDGSTPLWGKTFLIRAEQGLGDTLHFIRYAQLLKNQGAFVVAEVQKPLVQILSHCPYIDQVIAIGDALPPFDVQATLLSLPVRFKTTMQSIPATIPYLFASLERCSYWHKKLENEKRFKIGICWYGDPAHGSGKFMPLQEFVPLMQRPDVCVYGLQMYNGLDQIAQLPTHVQLHQFNHDFDKKHGSFMDTAAVMKDMDLIICVDTSIAHLAGGLGVPTWVILPFPAEWRWLTDRHDSPWYPTMTLFRQSEDRNWHIVMQEMLKTLDGLIAMRKSLR